MNRFVQQGCGDAVRPHAVLDLLTGTFVAQFAELGHADEYTNTLNRITPIDPHLGLRIALREYDLLMGPGCSADGPKDSPSMAAVREHLRMLDNAPGRAFPKDGHQFRNIRGKREREPSEPE